MAVRLPQALRPVWPEIKVAYTRCTRVVAPLTERLSRLRGGYLPRRSAATVDACVGQGTARMWVARPREEIVRSVPPGDPPRHPTFVAQAREVIPRVAVAELDDGRVLGPHRVVVDRRGTMIEEFCRYWGTTHWREHPMFWHPFADPPLEVDGALAVIAGRGDLSYYHFLLDILPRLAILETPGVPTPDGWYVPMQRRFQPEVMKLAGFLPRDGIIDADAVLHVRARSLLVPGIPDTDLKTPPWVVPFLRERLRPAALDRVPERRIYVTRGTERNNRVVTNEHQVLEVLAGRGFTMVDPGTMSVAEQIRTFAEAEWIVAPHGGALANLAFASAGSSVVELFAPDFVQGCYWKLADRVPGLAYRYLVGAGQVRREGVMAGVMSDITVDLDALTRTLDALPVELPAARARLHT
jgi:hypothetical protein